MASLFALVFLSAWLTRRIVKLVQNRNLAKQTGLPYILSPVGEHDFVWMVLQKPLGPIIEKLPFGLGRFVRFTRRGWNFQDKCKAHQELGSVFIVVAPSCNIVHVGDAAAAHLVLSQRKDFLKPLKLAKLIDVFGQSVISTEGADWQRHRRLTAPTFNERNNALVWAKATRQSQQLLNYWRATTEKELAVTSAPLDTARMALDVLMAAGFGMTDAFRSTLDTKKGGFDMSYRDALYTCMSDVFMVFIVPSAVFSLPFLPKRLANYKAAISNFKRYLRNLVSETKAQIKAEGGHSSCGNSQDASLIRTLVARAQGPCEAKVHGDGSSSLPANILDDSEIYGNLFMFSFAGHETMAMTLAYAVYLFAAFPEWQEWVGAEINLVFATHNNIDTLDYHELFPKLKRCRAVMYEVLRLYPPALSIPKTTDSTEASIKIKGQEVTIPPNTPVYPNVMALQTNPEYWGQDCLQWKPSRWIQQSAGAPSQDFTSSAQSLTSEQLMDPPVRGCFVPWADGPRVCPGRKFSEVEFVAAISVLLWSHRISIRPRTGETLTEARTRASRVIEDSGINFTLRMWKPETVGLIFTKK